MRNILRKNKQPEFTTAMRADIIADFDAENREHERIEYEFAKKKLGGLATEQNLKLESEENTDK